MKIFIASVYNEQSLKWLDLQTEFIKKCTSCEFERVLFFHGNMNGFVKIDCPSVGAHEQHVFGLNEIIKEFNSHSSFTHCLILDSDAFPVEKNWECRMEKSMKLNSCHVACPIRYENLDTFFHPCVVFFSKEEENIKIVVNPITNLLGYSCDELVVMPTKKTFPLLKTNVFSPHPVASSIYYDMFYHHGFGSRDFRCRSVHINHYHKEKSVEVLTNQVLSEPERFISKLMGKKIYD